MSHSPKFEPEPKAFRRVNASGSYIELLIPPDGGWGWVVVFASFMNSLIVDGIIYSFGTFLKPISESLEVKEVHIASVGSLMTGCYLMFAPISSALVNKFGFKAVAISGSILGGVSFMISSLAPNLFFMYVFCSVFGGIGLGLIYVPSMIIVGFYFERWRALAQGITSCGSGVGTVFLSPINTILIARFGWRPTFMCLAMAIFSCTLFACLFRQIKPMKLHVKANTNVYEETDFVIGPLEREDIFYRDRLSKDSSYMSINLSCLSIIKPSSTAFRRPQRKESFKLLPDRMRIILASMLKCTLMKSPTFLLTVITVFIALLGLFVPPMFLISRTTAEGLTSKKAANLLSAIGFANIFGRALSGVISSFVDVLYVNNCALAIAGIATISSNFSIDYFAQMTYALVFGIAFGAFAALRIILIVHLLGLHNLTNAYGLELMFAGAAAAFSAPIAGFFKEHYGSYKATFNFAGGLLLLSSAMSCYLYRVNRYERKYNPDLVY